MGDPYKILGIPSGSSDQVHKLTLILSFLPQTGQAIKEAFLKLAQKYHPGLGHPTLASS
jgi:hypothetical protein